MRNAIKFINCPTRSGAPALSLSPADQLSLSHRWLTPFVAAALIIFLFAITEFTTFFNQQRNSRSDAWHGST